MYKSLELIKAESGIGSNHLRQARISGITFNRKLRNWNACILQYIWQPIA